MADRDVLRLAAGSERGQFPRAVENLLVQRVVIQRVRRNIRQVFVHGHILIVQLFHIVELVRDQGKNLPVGISDAAAPASVSLLRVFLR